ncbi:hypothetical protein AB0K15_47510 [Amycolatopsis sp. NPDC049253]|uniref:hypothetical protein n=1 Tax=Amycolatopsis sp. NPDC049253 TaxID=3155274 RepID=UPI00343C3821
MDDLLRLPGRTTRTCCARSIVAAISKKEKLPKAESRNTYRSCESHVCLYLRPHLAHIRRDKLSVAHPDGMFDAIVEHNDLIAEYRASGDPCKVAAVK